MALSQDNFNYSEIEAKT